MTGKKAIVQNPSQNREPLYTRQYDVLLQLTELPVKSSTRATGKKTRTQNMSQK